MDEIRLTFDEAQQAMAALASQAARLRHDPYWGSRYDADADRLDALALKIADELDNATATRG